jgi:interleukin receptor mimic protein A
MNHLKKILIAGAFLLTSPAYAVDFWHSDTSGMQQGICEAKFSFDSTGEEVNDVKIAISTVNKAGKKLSSGTLAVPKLGVTPVDRYATAFFDSKELCEPAQLSFVVDSATASIGGKSVDLLKTKKLRVREFKPIKIRVGK